MWDDWQQQMKCCGVESWRDWRERNPNYGSDKNTNPPLYGLYDRRQDYPKTTRMPYAEVPDSCCDPSLSNGHCEPITSKGIYLDGCFQKMVDEIEMNSQIIGGVAIGIIVVMIINAIIAIYMTTCGYHSSRPKHYYARTATSDQL
jgi:hypothetical protein